MNDVQVQRVPLAVAFGLSSIVGVEREIRHKVAGLRTHAMVGMGAAVIMLTHGNVMSAFRIDETGAITPVTK